MHEPWFWLTIISVPCLLLVAAAAFLLPPIIIRRKKHPSGDEAAKLTWRDAVRRAPLPWLICGWLTLGLALFALSFIALSLIYGGGMWPLFTENNALREISFSSLTLATVLAGSIAIATTIRRQQSTEQAHELDLKRHELDRNQDVRNRVSALRERFTTTSEQLLGHELATVRIAGAYALAALADDWIQQASSHSDKDAQESARRETQVCIDLLCSYIRTPRKEPITDINKAPTSSQAAESEVRATIISIISRHLQPSENGETPDWNGNTFDFRGAVFDDRTYSFHGIRTTKGTVIDFRGAKITSPIGFWGAEISSPIHFSRAEISGRIEFNSAKISSPIHFWGTKISGPIDFNSTEISSPIDFNRAEISGCIEFNSAKINGPIHFGRAEINGPIEFNSAEISNPIHFRGAEISGSIEFNSAKISSRIHFWGTKISGPIEFNSAEISSLIEFWDTEIKRPIFSNETVIKHINSRSPSEKIPEKILNRNLLFFFGTILSGNISFSKVELIESSILFKDLTFSKDGNITFNEVKYSGDDAAVSGPWPGTRAPKHWPPVDEDKQKPRKSRGPK